MKNSGADRSHAPVDTVNGHERGALFTPSGLRSRGFEGFVTFDDLRDGALERVPKRAGVYVVLTQGCVTPAFLERSTGGRFKGRDPTVPLFELERKWVAGAQCLYIGKAEDLQRRLRQYTRFGARSPVGHWGGRYIWQLTAASSLDVAWRELTPGETARQAEGDVPPAPGDRDPH